MAEPDLSRIVNLIMENPKLIEEIKNLSSSENDSEEKGAVTEVVAEEAQTATETASSGAVRNESLNRIRRKDLLCALKPYVSEERGRAIDSMMSIADILDMMRSK